MVGNRLKQVNLAEIGKLGSLSVVSAVIGSRKVMIMGVYWPCENKGGGCGSLWHRLGRENAVVLIKELMLDNVNRAKADSAAVVIGGDCNSDVGMGGSDDYGLEFFMRRAGLVHSAADLQSPSFQSNRDGKVIGTRIDHIVHTGVNITSVLCEPVVVQNTIFDHMAMVVRYKIAGAESGRYKRWKQKLQGVFKVEKGIVDGISAELVSEFEGLDLPTEGDLDAKDELRWISSISVQIAHGIQRPKARRQVSNGLEASQYS